MHMLVVKDSMILIHLAATSILQKACTMLGRVIISPSVHAVVEKGIEQSQPDAFVVKHLEESKHIDVARVTDKGLLVELGKYGLREASWTQ